MVIPEYASKLSELASSLPLVAGRISELAMNDLPAFANTVSDRAMELADKIPWLNLSRPKYVAAATEDKEEDKEAAAEDGFHHTERGVASAVSPAEEELEDPKTFE